MNENKALLCKKFKCDFIKNVSFLHLTKILKDKSIL